MKIKFTLVLLMLLGVFTLNAFAATYYVDSQSGNDSNNGTSTSTAWKSISKVNAMNFVAGDKILFKRGLTFIGSINVKNSGTSSAPITFSNYGTGNLPVIDVNNAASKGFSVINKNFYIIIDGFDVKNYNNVESGGGVRITYGTNITVQNCKFMVTGRAGVFVEGSKNVVVKNNYITTPNVALAVQTDGIYAQRNSGSIFVGNTIITRNLDPNPHVDCIQMYQENSPKIYNNYIEVASTCPKYQGIYADWCTGTFEIYNNICVGMVQTSSVLKFKNSGVGTATAKVIGNTIYGGMWGLFHTDDPNIIFKNNIVVTTGAYYPIYFQTSINNKANVTNNVYKRSGSGAIVYFVTSTASKQLTMSSWKSLGYDANSMENDPQFTSISAKDFTLKTTSPAVNKGYTFSSPFNVDRVGTVRPAGSFDIGAFEQKIVLAVEPGANLSKDVFNKSGNSNNLPDHFELGQNYPNPFNPSTSIRYALPTSMMVTLKVYNILGKEVATLVNEEKAAGYYEVNFNASNLASGTYIYQLQTGNNVDVKKMILMK
ncbi:MAG TPA: right-handed parallel beta-helix repeat-containing protein [Ignavibacteriaceae bacterium]|nr:right-handed parallel beta-helix repeat-containing protein [Ignavibacteriaceae bacterium]